MKRTLLFTCLMMLASTSAFALGLPITGTLENKPDTTITYKIRLYDQRTGGSQLHESEGQLLTNANSEFTIHAAKDADALVFGNNTIGNNTTTMFVELEFDGEVLQPRIEVGYAPYAKHAFNAQFLNGFSADDFRKTNQGVDYSQINNAPAIPTPREVSAPLTLTGNVIGMGLCADGSVYVADGTAWSCTPLPNYQAGAGLQLTNSVFAIKAGGVVSSMIASSAVNGTHIQSNSVDGGHLQSNAVDEQHIKNGAIYDRHVLPNIISASKIVGTAAVLGSNTNQSFGTQLHIKPSAAQVAVGTGTRNTELEVNGDITVSGKVQRKVLTTKTIYIPAQSFMGRNHNPSGNNFGDVTMASNGLAISRTGYIHAYRLYKQLDVEPGDTIRKVECYHRSFDFSSQRMIYTANLVRVPHKTINEVVIATKNANTLSTAMSTLTINTQNRTVAPNNTYSLFLSMLNSSGLLAGCSVEVLTRRL